MGIGGKWRSPSSADNIVTEISKMLYFGDPDNLDWHEQDKAVYGKDAGDEHWTRGATHKVGDTRLPQAKAEKLTSSDSDSDSNSDSELD